MKRRLSNEGQMSMRQERMLGVAMLIAGLAIAGVAVSRMGPEAAMHAQATPPTAPSLQDDKPAQSMPGGTRPTTPAPEPARPQNKEGSTTGIAPASPLPPAPAEKVGPPIEKK
jgi:hypothetical protein